VAYAGDERFQAWLRSLARSEAARVKAVPLPPKAS
jgi:hypothetical protein